jgi:hypothetical protein
VSGSPATLAAGQMSVMVGGDRAAFDHVAGVLGAIGPKVTYIGPNGHAILTKVAINLALVVSVTAFAEGVALVEKAGVDRAAVVDAVLKSVVASPVIGYRAPLLVEDGDVYADVDLQQKDLVLAQELARRLGAVTLVFKLKAGERGKTFGSVTSKEVADALAREAKTEIERTKIVLHEPLRTLGVHTVEVRLLPDVRADVTVAIEPA